MDKATTTTREKVPVSSGIERADRAHLAELLGQALADTYVLYAKIQGYHWNVIGPQFYPLHKMTEQQYEDLAASIDELAERIRAIGFPAPSTLAWFVQHAEVKEQAIVAEANTMIDDLVRDHQAVAKSLRHAVKEAVRVGDVFSADMLTARIGKHEEFSWMLRAQGARP